MYYSQGVVAQTQQSEGMGVCAIGYVQKVAAQAQTRAECTRSLRCSFAIVDFNSSVDSALVYLLAQIAVREQFPAITHAPLFATQLDVTNASCAPT